MFEPRPAADILFDLVSTDDCSYDHNRSCQTHGFFYLGDDGLCPQAEAKVWLSRHGSDAAKRWLIEHRYFFG